MKRFSKAALGYVLVFVILIGFLIYAVVSSPHKTAKTKPTSKATPPITSLNAPQASNTSGRAKATPTGTTSTQPVTDLQANQVGKQLANTGPGDTALLFVAISAAGTLLYELRLRARNQII